MQLTKTHSLTINNYILIFKYIQTTEEVFQHQLILLEAFININHRCYYYIKGTYEESIYHLKISTEYKEYEKNDHSINYTINNLYPINYFSKNYTLAKEAFNKYIKKIVLNDINKILKSKKTIYGNSL